MHNCVKNIILHIFTTSLCRQQNFLVWDNVSFNVTHAVRDIQSNYVVFSNMERAITVRNQQLLSNTVEESRFDVGTDKVDKAVQHTIHLWPHKSNRNNEHAVNSDTKHSQVYMCCTCNKITVSLDRILCKTNQK